MIDKSSSATEGNGGKPVELQIDECALVFKLRCLMRRFGGWLTWLHMLYSYRDGDYFVFKVALATRKLNPREKWKKKIG